MPSYPIGSLIRSALSSVSVKARRTAPVERYGVSDRDPTLRNYRLEILLLGGPLRPKSGELLRLGLIEVSRPTRQEKCFNLALAFDL
jgi:hypothetical protein